MGQILLLLTIQIASGSCAGLFESRVNLRNRFAASNGPQWVQVLEKHETVVFRNSFEHPNPRVLVIALHGLGTNVSRAQGLSGIQSTIGGAHRVEQESIAQKVRDLGSYEDVVVEAIALPGHDYGPPLSRFKSKGDLADWLSSIIRDRKEIHGNIPAVLLTRSASNVLASITNKQHPDLIDGLVFMSPTKPGDLAVTTAAESFLRGLAEQKTIEDGKNIQINEPGFAWAKDLILSESWENENFGKVPTLIVFGGIKNDPEVSPSERQFSENLGVSTHNISVYTFDQLGHSVLSVKGLSPRGQTQVIEVHNKVFKLVQSVIQRRIYYNIDQTNGPVIFRGGMFH